MVQGLFENSYPPVPGEGPRCSRFHEGILSGTRKGELEWSCNRQLPARNGDRAESVWRHAQEGLLYFLILLLLVEATIIRRGVQGKQNGFSQH